MSLIHAGVVQRLEFQPSKLAVRVRFPSPAPERNDNLSKDKTSFLFVFLSSLSNCRLQIKDKREQIRTPMSGG